MPEVAPSLLSPTVISRVVSAGNVPLAVVAVTVTSVADALSAMLEAEGEIVSVIVASSSSVSVMSAPFTVSPVAVPSTEIVSSPSMLESSVGVSVKVAEPLDAPFAIEMSKPVTAA